MSDTSQSLNNSLNGLFSNTAYLFEFLAIYIVAYFLMGFVFNRTGDGTLRLVRILDTVVLIFIIIYLVITYGDTGIKDVGSQLSRNLSYFKTFAENPYSIFAVVLFIVLLYSAIYLVRLPMTPDLKPFSIMMVENIAFLLFIALLIIDFFKYVLNIDLLDYTLDGLIRSLTTSPSSTPSGTTDPSSTPTGTKNPSSTSNDNSAQCPAGTIKPTATPSPQADEVFNIRNNLYTYSDAQEVCSIYGAKLATYDQIEDAYNDGGEWCNYGWSDGQMALFPTQKSTWKVLQGSDKTKNACGRPGINGGYIKNKNVRFGVNCYGKKPSPSASESALMSANATPNIPVSAADLALRSKLNILKENADKFLLVNSFNRNKWSEASQ
jgi:hypothetical protein